MAIFPSDQRSQVMMLLTIAAIGGGYLFWNYYYKDTSKQIADTAVQIDSLRNIVERAKQDLARGTMEDLRQKVDRYRTMLGLMRRLVPEQNEVPAMIDDISTRAKVRGVTIGRIEPMPVEPGPPFDTYRYKLEIMGHYDQLGEYLSDIASLPRIVVPQDVVLKPASQGAQRLLNDTLGTLLQVNLTARTFVKSSPPPATQKPAAKPGAKPGAAQ